MSTLAMDGTTHLDRVEFPFFLIADGEMAVLVGDVIRVGVLIVAFMLVGATVNMMRRAFQLRNRLYMARSGAMIAFLVSIAGTEYLRIGDPISSRLPLNIIALVLSMVAFKYGTKDLLEKVAYFTDVRRNSTGEWCATCECGKAADFLTASEGWAWIVAHPCPVLR